MFLLLLFLFLLLSPVGLHFKLLGIYIYVKENRKCLPYYTSYETNTNQIFGFLVFRFFLVGIHKHRHTFFISFQLNFWFLLIISYSYFFTLDVIFLVLASRKEKNKMHTFLHYNQIRTNTNFKLRYDIDFVQTIVEFVARLFRVYAYSVMYICDQKEENKKEENKK